jgi:hypothetical protein
MCRDVSRCGMMERDGGHQCGIDYVKSLSEIRSEVRIYSKLRVCTMTVICTLKRNLERLFETQARSREVAEISIDKDIRSRALQPIRLKLVSEP